MNRKQNLILVILILIFVGLTPFWLKIIGFLLTPRLDVEIFSYKTAFNHIVRKEKIAHFPKKIPKGAKDVQICGYSSSLYGETLLLKFKINKEYIKQEMNKYDFINKNTPVGTVQKIYFMPSDGGRIKSDDMTFYVIKDDENLSYYKQYFPFFSGIGVSRDLEYILYYYYCPADYF